jgi:predicted lipoprotein with Yx(FWY)xxD motif
MRRRLSLLALACALPAVIAACGGSSSHQATVASAHSGLGTVLVDAQGRTLYLFEKDAHDMSSCSSACASAWPPATTTGTPKVTGAAAARLVGTTRRSDGTTELTYAGHPLYRYGGDQKAGQTRGEGLNQFGAEWYVLAPSGQKIDRS